MKFSVNIAVMKMVKLEKQGDSDQHGYVITNPVVKDTYLKVTGDETLRSRAVRFEKKSEEVHYWIQNNSIDHNNH